jgi:hypothetical protein
MFYFRYMMSIYLHISSLPTYMMSFLVIPIGVLKKARLFVL